MSKTDAIFVQKQGQIPARNLPLTEKKSNAMQ